MQAFPARSPGAALHIWARHLPAHAAQSESRRLLRCEHHHLNGPPGNKTRPAAREGGVRGTGGEMGTESCTEQ